MDGSQKAIFLDRDGVINRTVFRRGAQRAPDHMGEWVWVDGVQSVLQALHARGYLLVVCTNQPDVPRGWQKREQVDAFHERIVRELPVARVYACFHDNADACSCRKPLPGMLLQARAEFGIAVEDSYMIGDRPSDIQAGQAAGCRTILYDEQGTTVCPGTVRPDHRIQHLSELLTIAF